MIAFIKVFVLFAVFTSSFGFLYDKCDVFPQYPGGIPDSDTFTTSVTVPAGCRNGTFRWDYPKGHAMLQFHSTHKETISICIRDSLGGDIFNITDTASNHRLGHFDDKMWACFAPTSARDIVLKIDAPEMLMYMGEFEYKTSRS